MRVAIASVRPPRRAARCRSGGNRPTRIVRKIRLSTPRTISSADSVTNASQAWGSVSVTALRYGRWSMAAFLTVGNTCSAVRPKSSAIALEM